MTPHGDDDGHAHQADGARGKAGDVAAESQGRDDRDRSEQEHRPTQPSQHVPRIGTTSL